MFKLILVVTFKRSKSHPPRCSLIHSFINYLLSNCTWLGEVRVWAPRNGEGCLVRSFWLRADSYVLPGSVWALLWLSHSVMKKGRLTWENQGRPSKEVMFNATSTGGSMPGMRKHGSKKGTNKSTLLAQLSIASNQSMSLSFPTQKLTSNHFHRKHSKCWTLVLKRKILSGVYYFYSSSNCSSLISL